MTEADKAHVATTLADLTESLQNEHMPAFKYHYTTDRDQGNSVMSKCHIMIEDDAIGIYNLKVTGENNREAWVRSNASFNVKDLSGFFYGPTSSRFWSTRKQIITAP